ncbi:MAG: phosphatase PAP2 family protein [Acidobacteria bacterium]|nr:phosphatase PAP2 family protein [Acidobacteriota bacterium]
MRASEWIQLGSAFIFAVASWLAPLVSHPLPLRRRWAVTGLAAVTATAIALAHLASSALAPNQFEVVLDCLTVVLFLIPYWQTGQFFREPNHAIENRLLAFDRRLLPHIAHTSGTSRNLIGFILEMAYLSCYPLVPLGVTAIYAAGLRERINGFWLVLLLATYICYAVTPFVPAYPPRSLVNNQPATVAPANKGRIFNRWLLKHGSIHAISFPSAHVASAFAIALVLLHYAPYLGATFLIIAIMISLGAVIGRYHYALDVILGAVTALIVFLACYRHL